MHRIVVLSETLKPRRVSRLRRVAVLLTVAVSAVQSAGLAAAQSDSRIEGFTEPHADIQVAAPEMGTLSAIAVHEGDRVTEGQLLANLDDEVLQAALEVARAGMQATGALQSATADLNMRTIELQKLHELRDRNHASQQEVDRVVGEVAIAEARVQSVRDDLEIKRLEFERIQAQLRQRQIRSTIDGVVVQIFKDRGEFVSPSDAVVARIVKLDPLLVVFSVPVRYRAQLKSGQQVQMQIGSATDLASGTVEFVSPTADASSGTVKVKVRLPNPDGVWHSGDKSVLLLEGVPRTNKSLTPEFARRNR